MKFVLLVSDALFFLLVLAAIIGGLWARRVEHLRASWRRVGQNRVAMAAATLLVAFTAVALLDSVHYRERLPGEGENYAVEVRSLLDGLLADLRTRTEKTYSAPLSTHSFAKETIEGEGRDFPRLKFGGAHLGENLSRHGADIRLRILKGLGAGVLVWLTLWLVGAPWRAKVPHLAWDAVFLTLLVLCLMAGPVAVLAQGYHVFGTDKVGQDVLYLTLKSIRTGLLIGTLTTLIMLPAAIFFGILAGYAGGWIDDVIQYLYTTLNSIPGVLLIAAAVLMMQVVIDTHPEWFATSAERADARLIALCAILGLTSWTGLCRLLRGETLKLRELEYVQAARALGVSGLRILARHILPNVMHIVMIAIVMDFSGLVLAEAVLSYVGIGVDPNTISFGTMINAARMELAREPMVWWSLAAAFVFMFVLVLAANLFADVVRDAFDPRAVR
ncbi:ABC transporter permease [Sulfuricystis multivorans]|uniref:ABC transporter permease n=1 Tax=Sulfuricystis multivorans TaxID=2211108 RepID=UPI000F821663|nr:ABC transporter permease [Sulfuricystis multivorans]